jgi:putative NADPH-quinone reductase
MQSYLRLDDHNKPIVDSKISWMQEQITWADELVFVYPIWRYDAPAVLKNWFDVNMSA